jgi:hypothetical protein
MSSPYSSQLRAVLLCKYTAFSRIVDPCGWFLLCISKLVMQVMMCVDASKRSSKSDSLIGQ